MGIPSRRIFNQFQKGNTFMISHLYQISSCKEMSFKMLIFALYWYTTLLTIARVRIASRANQKKQKNRKVLQGMRRKILCLKKKSEICVYYLLYNLQRIIILLQ